MPHFTTDDDVHNLNIEEPVAFNRALDDFFHAAEHGRWRCEMPSPFELHAAPPYYH
jgi:hypothetical protein